MGFFVIRVLRVIRAALLCYARADALQIPIDARAIASTSFLPSFFFPLFWSLRSLKFFDSWASEGCPSRGIMILTVANETPSFCGFAFVVLTM